MSSNDPVQHVQLSYSSSTLISNCEEKYAHYKVYGTEIDSDAEVDTDAFKVGKAYHLVLEKTMHRNSLLDADLIKLVEECCDIEQTEETHLVYAMVIAYYDLHYYSGLEVVACEFKIDHPNIIGFVDAIMVDRELKEWWIVDLKTASMFDKKKVATLANDVQLNLYSYFKDTISSMFELDEYRFAGCRYRVTTKSKAKSIGSYQKYAVKTIGGSIKAYDVVIPVQSMSIDEIWNRHLELGVRAANIFNGEAPKRNLSYCMSYFKPCQYFSKCHGKTFTESLNSVEVFTLDKYIEETGIINLL